MNLSDLIKYKGLSSAATAACVENNFSNLKELLDYYSVHSGFSKLHVGKRVNQELIDLCSSELSHSIPDDSHQEKIMGNPISIFQDQLSVRSYNVCRFNGLITDHLVLNHYLKFGTFKNLRNCGNKSNKELCGWSIEIQNGIVSEQDVKDLSPNQVKSPTQDFSEDRIRFIELRFKSLFASLSLRSKNCLKNHFKTEELEFQRFYSEAICRAINFKRIRNSGVKTEKELNQFRKRVKDLIEDTPDDIDVISVLLFQISETLNIDLSELLKYEDPIRKRKLNLIEFIDFLISTSSNIPELTKDILLAKINFRRGDKVSNQCEVIGSQHKLSRERVRQLWKGFDSGSIQMMTILNDLLPFSYDLSDNLAKDYWEIEYSPDTSKIPDRIINDICSFSNLLNLICKGYFVLDHNIELNSVKAPYRTETYRKYKSLRITFTINEKFLGKDDIIQVFNEYYNRMVSRVDVDSIYSAPNTFNHHQVSFLNYVLSRNFEVPEKKGGVLLKRNTPVLAAEVLEKILDERDELLTAKEIQIEYRKRTLDYKKTLESIRSVLGSHPFVYFSGGGDSQSRYGLEHWLEEKGLIAGSIKELCYDYISKFDVPIHYSELSNFVLNHRDTNQRNILTNLRMDVRDQFQFFKGGFIGLVEKSYSTEFLSSLKQINPKHPSTICEFIRNQHYYEYRKLVEKFSVEFDLKEVQVRSIIDDKINEGTFYVRDQVVYYAQQTHDSIFQKVFKDYKDQVIRTFNPYRISIKKTNCLVRIVLSNNHEINVSSKHLEFEKYDLSNSDLVVLLYYNPYLHSYLTIIFNEHLSKEYLIDSTFRFPDGFQSNIELWSSGFEIFKGDVKDLYKISLRISNSKLLPKNRKSNELDISIFNIDGMNKLDSYAEITWTYEKTFGQSIDLNEAKRIYELILIGSN